MYAAVEHCQKGIGRVQLITVKKRNHLDVVMGKNLSRLREAAGFKRQQDFADALGILSQNLISQWEIGMKSFGKENLQKFCQILKCQPYEFFIDEDTPIIKDRDEQEALFRYRKEKLLGIAEDVIRFSNYMMGERGTSNEKYRKPMRTPFEPFVPGKEKRGKQKKDA